MAIQGLGRAKISVPLIKFTMFSLSYREGFAVRPRMSLNQTFVTNAIPLNIVITCYN